MTDVTGKKNGGKPPKKWGKGKTDPDTSWKKSAPSPNPNGRPKGSKNQKTLYTEAYAVKVGALMDGKPTIMPRKDLGYHQLAQKFAGGDLKVIAMQLVLDEKYDPVEAVPPTPEESKADYQTYQAWFELREKFKVFEEPEEVVEAPSHQTESETGEGDIEPSDAGDEDNG